MGSSKDKEKSSENEKKDIAVIDSEAAVRKYPYPKSIGFIITNEFCERFSFYGMRTILSLYLAEKLRYSDDDAVVIYHVFIMFVYFFPIFGAMIADSWLGRFKTIFYLSIVYAIGNILISLTAMPTLGIPDRAFTIVGLLLVAIGTGGIKPCVSAFGGDQFKLPEQANQLATFFSLFYFAINAGSFISTFVTPILRVDVHCFGDQDCYSLAFGVPGVLMIVSILIFLSGKFLYVIRNPAGNVLVEVFRCIGHAISRRRKLKKQEMRNHWLEYADDEYDDVFINDIKCALKVLLLFIPLPVFWALFDQQGSRWTFQATRMNGDLGGFILKPDQMQVVNPLLILIFIPLFEVAIYPALKWCKIIRKPLHKMILGGMLAAVAFIISAVVEIELEKTYPVLPGAGGSHLRMYNGYDCDLKVTSTVIDDEYTFMLKALSAYENKTIPVNQELILDYTITPSDSQNCPNFVPIPSTQFKLEERTAISHYISDLGDPVVFIDESDKSSKGYPVVRLLKNFDGEITFEDKNTEKVILISNNNITYRHDMVPSKFDILHDGKLIKSDEVLELGGVYSIIITKKPEGDYGYNIVELSPPNSVHMLLLLPQYIILTMGEVMFSVTGLEFSFTQAPASMKSVLTAGWLLTVAFGNLIVVIVAESKGFSSQVDEFFLFAGLMILDMIIFWLMTLKYEYVDITPTEIEDVPEKPPLPSSDFPERKKESIVATVTKPGDNKTDDSKTGDNKTDDKKTDDSKTDDSKTDDKKTDDSKTDDSKTDDSKTDDSKTDDKKTDDSKTDDKKTEENKADDNKTDDSKTVDSKTDDNKTDDNKTDNSKMADNKADVSKMDDNKTDNTKMVDDKIDDNKTNDTKKDVDKTDESY
ncbi:peptide transporter family 1-like [Arctopsyche grandis]|uniref:peptide transporter family 1-like n=1 Tax=Arctopsyche grandis TaxID=121162 RepID=UPI00406D804C